MAYFIEVDPAGMVTALYVDAEGYAAPPVGAIQISDESGEILRHGFAGYRCDNGIVSVDAAYEAAQSRQARIKQIKIELAILDGKKIRPMSEGDTAYLATLNASGLVLRDELITLSAMI